MGGYLRAEVRALDAQLDAGGALELGLAAAAVRLAHPRLHRRHAAWLPEEGGTAKGRGGCQPSSLTGLSGMEVRTVASGVQDNRDILTRVSEG